MRHRTEEVTRRSYQFSSSRESASAGRVICRWAVIPVDPVMTQQHSLRLERQAGDGQVDGSRGRGCFFILIVPDQDRNLTIGSSCQGVHIGFPPRARSHHGIHVNSAVAIHVHSFFAHQPSHAKYIQYRFVHAIRCERAKTIKVWLVFKLEGPSENALQIDVFAFFELQHRL